MYGARGFESRKGSTRTNNPTPASCRNAASGEWPNRDRVVGCSTANGLHDRGAGRRKSIKSKPFGSRPTYPAPHDAEPARIAAGARRPITKPVAGRSAAASTRDTAGSHDSRPGLAMIVQVTRRPVPGFAPPSPLVWPRRGPAAPAEIGSRSSRRIPCARHIQSNESSGRLLTANTKSDDCSCHWLHAHPHAYPMPRRISHRGHVGHRRDIRPAISRSQKWL